MRRIVGVGLLVLALAVLLAVRTTSSRKAAPGPGREPRREPTARAVPTRGPALPRSLRAGTAGPPALAAEPVADDDGASLPRDTIPGDYTYRFYDAAQADAFVRLADAYGLDVVGRIDRLNAVRIRSSDEAALRRLLEAAPTPVGGGLNVRIRRPPDPDVPESAAPEPPLGVVYRPFGELAARWLGLEGAPADWGDGVTVAVLDTGVGGHPALAGAVGESMDLAGGATEGEGAMHGTAVASLIAGRGEGLAGIAPGAELMDVRVMDAAGNGNSFTVAQGILAAVDGGADVLNLCLGSYGDSDVLHSAVDYALRQGVAVVAAVGNDGLDGTVMYPAAYEGVIAVAAVDMAGQGMYFSNQGRSVDLAAPGYGVNAAGAEGAVVSFSGTSAAAPFVSAAIAALLSAEPDLTPARAASLLVAYADDTGVPGNDSVFGAGLMNVPRVLERNTPGIRDMAIAAPHAAVNPVYPDEMILTLFAQNRGTEPLPAVTMRVEVDGAVQELKFYDVGVGENAVHEARLTGEGIGERRIDVLQEVSIDGKDDTRPLNNRMRAAARAATP